MKLFFKIVFYVCILEGTFWQATAQEYILPLQSNPALHAIDMQEAKKALNNTLIELPFADDFSYASPYPSNELWADNYAFINTGYAIDPPTIGVATLDALDWDGSVYSFATISPETFDADYLTSQPINLAYSANDSIYLSFFYQPQGNGLEPKPYDSLCLDFYNPDKDLWTNVWRVPGDTLREFTQVMISIKDTAYLKEGFRFSFRNKASLSLNNDYKDKRGNVDHWNIDYIRLDRNRAYSDTIIRDVAFTKIPGSMTRETTSLPWDHFKKARNTIYLPYVSISYFNNDSTVRNVTRNMEIIDEVWDETYKPGNPSTQDILPGTFSNYDIQSVYPFQLNRGDTARFKIKTWLRTDDFDNKANDTTYRIQVFKDFFAYDDGSAERAYGLRGQGTNNGLIAVKFQSYIDDELGGVDVYFTQLKDSLNLGYYFKFMVWSDNDGEPGDLLYEDETDYTAEYSDLLNKYVRFSFDQTVPISGTFYVGIKQYNQYLLNIGLDINIPTKGKLFYNLGNEWNKSEAPGTLMFRPYVKRSYSSSDLKFKKRDEGVKIWPNPASDFIKFDFPDYDLIEDLKISVYDISGKQVMAISQYQETVSTENLRDGFYIISFASKNKVFSTGKLIIKR